MIRLVSESETYEKVWKQSELPEDQWPVFVLRKLNGKDGNDITDEMTDISTGQFRYRPGVARQVKVNRAVVGWKNVVDSANQAVECNDQNKGRLPFEIQLWLEDIINKDNGFELTEEQRKNS